MSNSTGPHWVEEEMNSLVPRGSITYPITVWCFLISSYVIFAHSDGPTHTNEDIMTTAALSLNMALIIIMA